MGYGIKTEDGFEFSTNYEAVFNEPGNMEYVIELREQLRLLLKPAIVELCPGDGTRYQFLLVPAPSRYNIHHNSEQYPPRVNDATGSHLYVTSLYGMVKGVASVSSANDIEGIRHRLSEKADIDNLCTWEALARLVEAVWSDGWQRG